MNRRSFLSFLAALPVVGKYWKPKPTIPPNNGGGPSLPLKFYSHPPGSMTDTAYIEAWLKKDLDETFKRWDRIECESQWRSVNGD